MKRTCMIALALVVICGAGCDGGLKSARRLRLPPGDAARGKAAFVALDCVRCHTVAGVDLPAPTATAEKVVALGGAVSRLRTIGDLVTSIIHPQFALSDKWQPPAPGKTPKSPMPGFNDEMTVGQMIDIVSFLQPRYTQLPPPDSWNYSL